MARFTYSPSRWVPFRDRKVLERVRSIRRRDITKHPNPDFRIRVVPDDQVAPLWLSDLFSRIRRSAEDGRPLVLILPNPAHLYVQLARRLNRSRVSCRHLHVFIMDEYANEHGEVAPETWPLGFMHSFKKFFFACLDPKLRPPERQIHGPTTKNIRDYGRMIADQGGGDACYTGPGWTGHLAFIEPDAPEFDAPLAEWKKMGPRIVTLSPFTIAQNSLHGFFGMSGDLAAVPPRAATIGPAEVIAAKYRMDINALTTAGTFVSWQRFTTRLAAHGPVTPRVPTSIHQLLKTDFIISDTIAADIEPNWNLGY
jgi:6-phosphogluconolactonase/glucosamine-6-phosphate isomerase/deaminase